MLSITGMLQTMPPTIAAFFSTSRRLVELSLKLSDLMSFGSLTLSPRWRHGHPNVAIKRGRCEPVGAVSSLRWYGSVFLPS